MFYVSLLGILWILFYFLCVHLEEYLQPFLSLKGLNVKMHKNYWFIGYNMSSKDFKEPVHCESMSTNLTPAWKRTNVILLILSWCSPSSPPNQVNQLRGRMGINGGTMDQNSHLSLPYTPLRTREEFYIHLKEVSFDTSKDLFQFKLMSEYELSFFSKHSWTGFYTMRH